MLGDDRYTNIKTRMRLRLEVVYKLDLPTYSNKVSRKFTNKLTTTFNRDLGRQSVTTFSKRTIKQQKDVLFDDI